MPRTIRIDDPADTRLDDYREMRRPDGRRATDGNPFLLAEGANVVRRLLESDLVTRSVLLAENRTDAMSDVVDASTAPVYVVGRDVMTAVVGFDLHRGVVASADRPVEPDLGSIIRTAMTTGGTIAVLQGLNDHENLGAIARSARALGVQAFVLDETCADPWYRRTVRVSMGEILHLPVVRLTSMQEGLSMLRAGGMTVAALTPNSSTSAGESSDIQTWVRPPGGLALVLGAEGPGLPDDTLSTSDVRLRIPITNGVDSLNVGHAAAIAFAVCRRSPAIES